MMTETVRRNLRKFFLIALVVIGAGFAFLFAERNSFSMLWILILFSCIAYMANTIPKILLGTREEKLLRYFSRKSTVRIKLVKDVVAKVEPVKEQLETLEVIAVFSILLAKHDISQAIDLMSMFSHMGWDKYFNDNFFSQVMKTSTEFRAIGLHLDHKEIIQFGETTARQHNQLDWAETFRQKREQILQRQRDAIEVIRHPRR